MTRSVALKTSLERAQEYVAKIGAPQHHFRDGSVGKLHSVKVSTEIHHQLSSGSTNYWNCKDFDEAFANVIRDRFQELATATLALMERQYKDARIQDRESLLAQLREIDALEAEAEAGAA